MKNTIQTPVKRKAMTFTLEQLEEAMECQGGFCIACGDEAGGVEPDARKYECESCGKHAVYGAAELVLMGLVS